MNDQSFRPAREYHYPNPTMHKAICGRVVDRDDLSTGLTTDKKRIDCAQCRSLMPESYQQAITFRPHGQREQARAMGRKYGAANSRAFHERRKSETKSAAIVCETVETSEAVRASLRVSWK